MNIGDAVMKGIIAGAPKEDRTDAIAIARAEAAGHIGWRPYAYEAIAGGVLLTGGVPHLKKYGPEKGLLSFRGAPVIKTAVLKGELE